MTWTIKFFDKKFEKNFKKIDKTIQKRIKNYLKDKVAIAPYSYGKPLSGDLSDFWRYRVGNYRIICRIKDEELIVLVIEIDHRSKVYKFLTN